MSLLKTLVEEINAMDSMGNDISMDGEQPSDDTNNDQDARETAIHSGIVKFLTDNPHPSDEDIHQFADEHNMEPSEMEERIYSLLHALLKGVGKHNDVPDDDFDPEQLQQGIEIEKEHTNNALVAKMIAKDHLSEIPDYYTRLIDMEQGARQPNDNFSDSDEANPKDDSGNEVDFKLG